MYQVYGHLKNMKSDYTNIALFNENIFPSSLD